ncbi:MAG: hypothetical protein QOH68_3659 [Nocardioidaceae bacterium]|nr:hypothetical protein [Nocardioidaceae bacterium]
MRLAADEYDRFVAQLRELSPDHWSKPTVCPAWDVHAMACHVLGMAEFAASVPEQFRQMRAARKTGGMFIDALTALQVDKHITSSPAALVAKLAEVGPRAAAGRRRTPALVRRIALADQPVEETGTQTEKWTLGYMTDVILTRDTWMHRSDIAAATGQAMTLTPEHDGVLVADVAAEWAARHQQPCTITLTGPAGGAWTFNDVGDRGDPAVHELDAVEFCRILSGRGSGAGLLTTRVPF